MNAQELLLSHQLNVARYWEDKTGQVPTDPSDAAGKPANRPLELPAKWQLVTGIDLHGWQQDCLEKWFSAGKQGVAKVVTGAGKTIFALAVAQRLQNTEQPELRVAIVVPTIVLMDQWYDAIRHFSNLPASAISRMGGGHTEDFSGDGRILICVLASAYKLLSDKARAIDPANRLLLIVDECHRAGAEQMSNVFRTPRAYTLGLSATPERDEAPDADEEEVPAPPAAEQRFEDSVLGQELGPIIYELSFAQAIERGIMPRFELRHYGLPLNATERGPYDRLSRDITELRKTLQGYNATTKALGGGALVGWARKASKGKSGIAGPAAEYVQLTGRRKLLVYRAKAREVAVLKLLRREFAENSDTRVILFHESIAEVMRLFEMLRLEGLPAVPEHSELADSLRAESVELFRQGAAKILVSARSLIEGFDVPAADVGIVVASSSSVRQRIQTLGRILRKHRDASGAEKHAVLHVLYLAQTVDELIYEKNDWNSVIGADRNLFFLWDPEVSDDIIPREGPPRVPPLAETKVDWSQLKPGDIYPGAYDGFEYSCDSMGNILNHARRAASNPQGVGEMIKAVTGRFGRFKVTPRKLAVLVRTTEDNENWTTKFAGFVPEMFDFGSVAKTAEAKPADISNLTPGDPYPGDPGRGEELRLKQRAQTAVIAMKVRGGEVFARTTEHARDRKSGEDAERIVQAAQKAAIREGQWVPRFRVNSHNHAVYSSAGQPRFLCALDKGLEFPEG